MIASFSNAGAAPAPPAQGSRVHIVPASVELDPEGAPADTAGAEYSNEDGRWTIDDVRRARRSGQFVLSKLADLQREIDQLNGWASVFNSASRGEDMPLPPLVFPSPPATPAAAASSSADEQTLGQAELAELEIEALNARS